MPIRATIRYHFTTIIMARVTIKKRKQVLASMWRNWNLHIRLVGTENRAATVGKSGGLTNTQQTYHMTLLFHS